MDQQKDTLQVCGSFQGDFRCTWAIGQFSSLDSEVGVCHKSETFQFHGEGLQWFLYIYPGGQTEKYEGYVSCYFRVKNVTQNARVKLRLSFRNTDGDVLFDAECNEWRTTSLTSGYGYPKTRGKDYLIPRLVDDTLVVVFEVTHYVTCYGDNANILSCEEDTWTSKASEDFRNLWTSKENADFVISVGREDILVHSLVLGARSKVFAAMLTHGMTERDNRRVEVTDFEKDTMNSFMEFLYSGNVREMDFNLAIELLRASDKYEVSDLKSYCSRYLTSLLNDQNVCIVLLTADIFDAQELRTQAMNFLCENMSQEGFATQRSIFKTRPELLCDIIHKMIECKKIELNSGDHKRRRDR